MKIVTIGRGSNNAIVISDNSMNISNSHGELIFHNSVKITYEDYSKNGTVVNGYKVHNSKVDIEWGADIMLPNAKQLDWQLIPQPDSGYNNDGYYITIGKNIDNQIRIKGDSVSRYHAKIKLSSDGRIYIYDQSTHGTTVNGRKIPLYTDYEVSRNVNVVFGNSYPLDWNLITEYEHNMKNLKQAMHPGQQERFILALSICLPVALVGIASMLGSLFIGIEAFLLIILSIGLILFVVWFSLQLVKVSFLSNCIKVSPNNYPELYNISQSIKVQLDYHKKVDIFICMEGGYNAFIYKFFNTKFILLPSILVEDMIKEDKSLQFKFIVARFVGALKARHFNMGVLELLISTIESIAVFNLFLLPYKRATQYTGDNIGLLVCRNLNETMTAFDKFFVGNKLSGTINLEGVAEQDNEIKNNFFAFLNRIASTHPPLVKRYISLVTFAKKKLPDQFNDYTSKYGPNTMKYL